MLCKSIIAVAALAASLTGPAGATTLAELAALKWTKVQPYSAAPELTLDGYDLAFSDEFNVDSLTPANGAGPWFANVIPFSFLDASGRRLGITAPLDFGQCAVYGGALALSAMKVSGLGYDGNAVPWAICDVQTADSTGWRGFSQSLGYFEARIDCANDRGSWCVFWLADTLRLTDYVGNGGTGAKTKVEIDVIEHYGFSDPSGHHHTVHLAEAQIPQPGELTRRWTQSAYNGHGAGLPANLGDGFHLYGMLIDDDQTCSYFDRKLLGCIKTIEEFKRPLFLRLTQELKVDEVDEQSGKITMLVDYVRVWRKK